MKKAGLMYLKEVKPMKKLQFKSFMLFIFSFMLLWEWLRPLEVATDTGHSGIFVFFICLSLFFKYLEIKWYISYPIKFFLILFFINSLFYSQPMFSLSWVFEFLSDFNENILLIRESAWLYLTPVFRTFLFFIMLWLLVYLIYYWIVVKRKILLFLILTFTYITILDTFTPYDASNAIIRLVMIGFFMMGYLAFKRLHETENIHVKRLSNIKWIVPLSLLISFSTLIGFLAPKAAPQWPDPVPYIKKIGSTDEDESVYSPISKIGYGADDQYLGGPFIEDDTPVFRAYTKERHYWRVETKDVYTGKGWIASGEEVYDIGGNVYQHLDIISNDIEKEPVTATVDVSSQYPFNHIMYPIELKQIDSQVNEFRLFQNEKIEYRFNSLNVRYYTVEYAIPEFQVDQLQQVTNQGLSREFLNQYTQLPASLPQRVRDLAVDITESEDNIYDKAKAIEEYFQINPYVYETKDVAIPEPHQDYVDQFLFDTRKGYCDNFSTSMIVLLRSVGIPARWVKGYSQGEFVEAGEDGYRVYQVTNNNAHSWVEVFFEGIGWVPFEPTKSFQNPYSFTYNLENTSNNSNELEETERVQQEEIEDTQLESQSSWFTKFISSFQLNKISLIILSAFTIVLALTAWLTKKKWMPIWTIRRYKYRKDEEVFFRAYQALIKHLEWYGIKKKSGQTLRQFAKQVDQSFATTEMSTLTKRYEQALYNRSDAKEEWSKSVELWENLIKKTSY